MQRLVPLFLATVLVLFSLSACRSGSAGPAEALAKARRLIEQGSYTAAFMQLNRALAEAPRDPAVHVNLGWLYLYTDDVRQAEREWRKAQALAPDQAEVSHLRGALLSAQARRMPDGPAAALQAQAVEKFRAALQRDDKNDQTYFDLATSLLALNRNEEALDVLDKGFDVIPKSDLETQINFQIASCSAHARIGLYDEAIADCRQAREFSDSPDQRQRIDDMIENMKLMNPPSSLPMSSSRPVSAQDQARGTRVVRDAASD